MCEQMFDTTGHLGGWDLKRRSNHTPSFSLLTSFLAHSKSVDPALPVTADHRYSVQGTKATSKQYARDS